MTRLQRVATKLHWWIPVLSLSMVTACLGQSFRQSAVLSSAVDRRTAVSFFWFGDMESHWRDPMNFFVVGASDPRLHSVFLETGSTAKGVDTWITATEMRALIGKLARSPLAWTDSETVESLKPWKKRKDGQYSFDITVVTTGGTARAGVRLARMCDALQQFDSVMPTPRLQWQFQTMRWDDGCVVAGYDNEAAPKE